MFRILAVIAGLAVAGPAAWAASPFDPAITVNGDVITRYEIEQRAGFLRAISTSGDLEDAARSALIDDRLRMAAARSAGITVSDADVEAEMEGFVARGNVTLEQFTAILGRNGVDIETFREIARANLVWRELIRSRFAARVTIGDEEVDRALTLTASGGLRVLLTELVVPVPEGDTGQTRQFVQDLRESLGRTEDFERAVRRYSGAQSRDDNGRLDWLDLGKLGESMRAAILGMSPGEISQPIELPNAIALFQLRALAEAPAPPPPVAALDYMLVRLPAEGGAERARAMAARSDVCADLYAHTDDLPEDAVTREARAPADIAPRIRAELARLDPGEVSTRLASPDGREAWLLMLCGRSAAIPEGQTRDQVVQQLRGQRFQTLADGYLSELRAAAEIERR